MLDIFSGGGVCVGDGRVSVSQSVSQLFHGPAPARSPLHRLAVRLRHVWVLLSCFRGTASELHAELSTQLATQLSEKL